MKRKIALLGDSERQAGEAKSRGGSADMARNSISLADHRRIFAGDDPVLNLLFSQYVPGQGPDPDPDPDPDPYSGIGAAYRELQVRAPLRWINPRAPGRRMLKR